MFSEMVSSLFLLFDFITQHKLSLKKIRFLLLANFSWESVAYQNKKEYVQFSSAKIIIRI